MPAVSIMILLNKGCARSTHRSKKEEKERVRELWKLFMYTVAYKESKR